MPSIVYSDFKEKYKIVKSVFLIELKKSDSLHNKKFIALLENDEEGDFYARSVFQSIGQYSEDYSVNSQRSDDIKIINFLGFALAAANSFHADVILKIMFKQMCIRFPYPSTVPKDMLDKINKLIVGGDLNKIKIKLGVDGLYLWVKTIYKEQTKKQEIHTVLCSIAEMEETDLSDIKAIVEGLIKEHF